VECCLASGRRWFLLRRESAGDLEPLVTDAAGAALTFATEEAARAQAAERGEPVSGRPPQEVDLDAIARWCERCDAAPPDPRALWDAWDFLGRTGALEERPADTHGDLDAINYKLSALIALAERPEAPGRSPQPELSAAERRRLASLLTAGTAALARRLSASAAR
jgi:hypothetical protein